VPGYLKGTDQMDMQAAKAKSSNRQMADLNAACPIRDVLDRVGDKWSVLIVKSLVGGSRRYGVLRREIEDISQRMLTETLRHLQRDGLVSRKVHPTTPPAVEYALTPLGHSLHGALAALAQWSTHNHDTIRNARVVFDAESTR
jgi:DNA-binding HxlR family transcriptional regulator